MKVNNSNEKKANILFFSLIFIITLVFFTLIHPLYIFDSDDWINIGLERPFIPDTNCFNPIKVFPEILFPLVSIFSTKVFYPLTGDFIGCIGGGDCAFIQLNNYI